MSVTIPNEPAEVPASASKWIGRSMNRVEDPLLLTGKAAFTDNLSRAGMVHCAILRSPQPHARIKSIDVSAAEKLSGVISVITGEDARSWSEPLFTLPPGWATYCLAVEKVRFVGEPIAAIAATSRYIAEDALDLIDVEFEPLPPVVDVLKALEPGSPLVYDEKGNNIIFQRQFTFGNVDAAFAQADHVISEKFRWHRMGGNPIETNGCITEWNTADGTVTSQGGYQMPIASVPGVAAALRLSSQNVRIIGQPHGGSFGTRFSIPRMLVITALLSRKSGGRPVKYIEDRIEHLVSGSSQSWDRYYEASIAVENDGRITGLKVRLLDDQGATIENSGHIQAIKPLVCFTGCYKIPTAAYDLTCVCTNKPPQVAYRGAGPPPHNFVLEQLIDFAARDLGMDPAEIRRKNFIAPDEFPYALPTGNQYDSGDYQAALDKTIEIADYQTLRREQALARKQGRLVGIGLVNSIEVGAPGGASIATLLGLEGAPTSVPEGASVRIDGLGRIVAAVGFPPEGQGQYTFVTQLLADYFGVEPADIKVVMLDSLASPPGLGPGGSRLAVALSGAILGAAERIREKLVKVAAVLLEASPDDIELKGGKLRLKGVANRELPLATVAATMIYKSDLLPPGVDGSPEATYVWNAPGFTPEQQGQARYFLTAANACHLVMLEVDPDSGLVEILKYVIVDDCGTRLNPAIVEGMTQGAVAQGVGAALMEEYVYDDAGQLLTSTYMDYLLPTIHEVPMTQKAALVTPSPFTPLGVKGAGEGAINTTPAAIMCAINDALGPLGVRATEVPATPSRLWKLVHDAWLSRNHGIGH